jgi:hypothetical protein
MNQGQTFIEVRSGDLNVDAGGQHGRDSRIAACCGVMYSNIVCRHGDEIIGLPAGDSGFGANLVIRYVIPRPETAGATGGIDLSPPKHSPHVKLAWLSVICSS